RAVSRARRRGGLARRAPTRAHAAARAVRPMIATRAAASLIRHRARTALAILGVAVSAAMLLDMVMLSSGMRESFRGLLLSQGFQLRLAPKGTLPFDTEATIRGADSLLALVRARPTVIAASPVLGGQLHFLSRGATVTA